MPIPTHEQRGRPAPSGGPFTPGPNYGNVVAAAGPVAGGDASNPLRHIAFRMATVLVFLDFSCLHQLLTYLIHVNLYLLYFFGVPTLLGVVLAGGIPRTLRARPAIYWALFAVWLIACAPFSSWRGGAVGALIPYLRTVFPLLFVVAGLTATWRECRAVMYSVALGGIVIMGAAKLFQDTSGRYVDRLALGFGTIANSNDYAVHLIFVLPFVIWVGLTAKFKPFRLAAWALVCFGLLLILKTASRGALVAVVVGLLYWLIRGTMRQRMVLLAAGPVLAASLIVFVPRAAMERILTFSSGESDASQEAIESSDMRRYLLEQSIIYTLQHPLFGVGMAQFSSFEGGHSQYVEGHGAWHETHNTYTEVSSECGIPALGLYLAAIVSTFLLVNGVYRQACKRTDCEDIRIATFCIMLSMVAYCTGILFVNFAYFFYLPMLSSISIAVCRSARDEFASRPSDLAAPQYGLRFEQRPASPRKASLPAPR